MDKNGKKVEEFHIFNSGDTPIAGVMDDRLVTWGIDGHYWTDNIVNNNDLVLHIPKAKKKEKWIVSYLEPFGNRERTICHRFYDSKKQAEYQIDNMGLSEDDKPQIYKIEIEED